MRSLGTIRDLAGGRLPPLTRTALATGLLVFLAALAFVRPNDGGRPAVEPVRAGIRWVGKGDGSAEAAVLLDPSLAYIPSRLVSAPESTSFGPKPTEEAPFSRLDRRLLSDPTKGDESPLKLSEPRVPLPGSAVALAQAEPFTTFGRANLTRSGLLGRYGAFEVYVTSGAKKPIISGILPHSVYKNAEINSIKRENNPLYGIFEANIGLDSLGLQGIPAIVRSSGDKAVDRAIIDWARGVPWARHLPPGSYRLSIVP